MNKKLKGPEYDAIVVGSGTCGATIARELSKQKKKVLISAALIKFIWT